MLLFLAIIIKKCDKQSIMWPPISNTADSKTLKSCDPSGHLVIFDPSWSQLISILMSCDLSTYVMWLLDSCHIMVGSQYSPFWTRGLSFDVMWSLVWYYVTSMCSGVMCQDCVNYVSAVLSWVRKLMCHPFWKVLHAMWWNWKILDLVNVTWQKKMHKNVT